MSGGGESEDVLWATGEDASGSGSGSAGLLGEGSGSFGSSVSPGVMGPRAEGGIEGRSLLGGAVSDGIGSGWVSCARNGSWCS